MLKEVFRRANQYPDGKNRRNPPAKKSKKNVDLLFVSRILAEMNPTVRLNAENTKAVESIIRDSNNPHLKGGTIVNFELDKTGFRRARKKFLQKIIPVETKPG